MNRKTYSTDEMQTFWGKQKTWRTVAYAAKDQEVSQGIIQAYTKKLVESGTPLIWGPKGYLLLNGDREISDGTAAEVVSFMRSILKTIITFGKKVANKPFIAVYKQCKGMIPKDTEERAMLRHNALLIPKLIDMMNADDEL